MVEPQHVVEVHLMVMRYYYCIPTSMAKIRLLTDVRIHLSLVRDVLTGKRAFSGDRNVMYGVDVVTEGNTVDPSTTWA